MEDIRHVVTIGTFMRTHLDGYILRYETSLGRHYTYCSLEQPTVYQKLDDTRMDHHGLFWWLVAVRRFWWHQSTLHLRNPVLGPGHGCRGDVYDAETQDIHILSNRELQVSIFVLIPIITETHRLDA